MKTKPRIVVVGSLVMDFVARGPRLPQKGETILGDLFGMFPGGKGANQAAQAGRLGAEVFMVGCVGDDLFGTSLLSSLKESGADTQFVRREPSLKTAACCIHVDRQGNNAITIVPEANLACCPADIDAASDVIRSADIVACQLEVPLTTVDYALRLAADHQIRTILNPAPAQPLSPSLLATVTILTPNETEAQVLTAGVNGNASESQIARALLSKGPQSVVITLGERGAYLATRKMERVIPAFEVQVRDATAAGDAFNGALAVALAEGCELEDAIVFANAAGALSTTRAGAQPSLPHRNEVDALLGKGK
jgi:ribokinase